MFESSARFKFQFRFAKEDCHFSVSCPDKFVIVFSSRTIRDARRCPSCLGLFHSGRKRHRKMRAPFEKIPRNKDGIAMP